MKESTLQIPLLFSYHILQYFSTLYLLFLIILLFLLILFAASPEASLLKTLPTILKGAAATQRISLYLPQPLWNFILFYSFLSLAVFSSIPEKTKIPFDLHPCAGYMLFLTKPPAQPQYLSNVFRTAPGPAIIS